MVRILQRLFALLTVLSMQTVYIKQVGKNFELYFIVLNTLVLLSLIFFKSDQINISKRIFQIMLFSNIMFFCVLGYRLFVSMNTNISASIMITLLITIFFDLALVYFTTQENAVSFFLKDTSVIIFVLALVSLFFFTFGQNLSIIKPNRSVMIAWGGNQDVLSWFGIHFNAQGTSYNGFTHGRNTGIFVEAPQYAFLLCYALIIELFMNKKTSIIKTFILLLTIYSTVSTTGIMIMIISLGIRFVIYRPKTRLLKYLKSAIIPFLVLFLILTVFSIYKEKTTFGYSYAIRSNNNKLAWINFLKSPIIGMGFKSDVLGISGGNTSTLTQSLQEGGLLFFSFYFFPFLKSFLIFCKRKQLLQGIFVGLYFTLLIPTVVTYTQFSIVMVAIMYSFYDLQKIKEDR